MTTPQEPRRVAFLGATQGMGRALARRLAARGDRLFLLGRSTSDLERSAADLEARSPGENAVAGFAVCDLESVASFTPALDAAEAALGGLDAVIVTAGIFSTQEAMEADLTAAKRLLEVNFTHTVIFCEHARVRLLANGGGHLVVFSSVAGDRGRKPVAIYGAAKAGLSRYLEAMDHKWRRQGLLTLDVKPGFVKTGMTAGLKAPPFAGEPERVAADVVAAMDRGAALLYTPAPWRGIMLVIRWLPRFLMRRLGF
ncbi:MAG: SDR family NAD(P)-dependent oxidoreductase [Acidobacteriota bacterium]